MKRFSLKGIILPLLLAVVGASIAVGAYVTTKGGSLFELRKKAAPAPPGAWLYFKGPTPVNIGEQFSVDLYLDTTNDPKYTISGVDARIEIDSNILTLTKVTPGTIFDSYPNQRQSSECDPLPPECYESEQAWRDCTVRINPPSRESPDVSPGEKEDSRFGGTFAPTKALSDPTDVSPWSFRTFAPANWCPFGSVVTPTPTCVPLPPCVGGTTDERGVFSICAVMDKPPGGGEWCPPTQKKCGWFLSEKCPSGLECIDDPSDLCDPDRGGSDCIGICVSPKPPVQPINSFIISGVKNYVVDEKGLFKGFTGAGVVATLTFVAKRPGKATLQFVYTSPTATDDTNVTGFLAYEPASLQKPQERLVTTPEAYTIEVTSTSPSATPTPTACPTPPSCKVPLIYGDPAPGSKDQCPKYFCPEPTPIPTPTPTPEPRVMINFRLQLEGRKSHTTVVDIYGMTTTNVQPNQKLLQMLEPFGTDVVPPGSRLDKLGTAVTDPSGTGVLSLDRTYNGQTYDLFAQTPAHLRKAAQNYKAIRLDVGQNPVCRAEICTQEVKYVDFDTLIAGDVYTDEKGNKDNLINTFDVGAILAVWSGADVVAKPRDQSTLDGILPSEIGLAADLNGDGVVNNRDLAMLLANFNKRGQ